MNNGCLFCEARQRMEREWRAEYGDEAEVSARIITTCECGGVKRFIAYGLQPTTEEEARQFFDALMTAFDLKQLKTGPGIARFIQVLAALEKHERLNSFAAELEVSPGTAQKLAKWATAGKTFRQYQTEKARKEKSRLASQLNPIRNRRRRS